MCTLLMERTRLTNRLREPDPNNGFPMPIANRPPTLTRLRRRTRYPMGLPIDGEMAVVKARSLFGLPTQIWHHRTDNIHLIAAVTLGKHIRIDIAHIHQMLSRKHLLLS